MNNVVIAYGFVGVSMSEIVCCMISGCSFPTSIPPALTQVTMQAMAFGLLAVASAKANPIVKVGADR